MTETKIQILEFQNNVTKSPLVTVSIQTYQHRKYISKCIEGVLMQKTDFTYEVLIGEDESTDGTREICIDYAKKYPDRIRLFLHSRDNVIYINNKPTGRFNLLWNFKHARGKYVAWCDGDDSWIDPYKLQKQVDLLEGNPDISLVHGNCHIYHEWKNLYIADFHSNSNNKLEGDIFKELLNGNYLFSNSIIFRDYLLKDFLNLFNEPIKSWLQVDFPLVLYMALKGKVGYIKDTVSVYNKHEKSVLNTPLFEQKLSYLLSNNAIQNYFIDKYLTEHDEKLAVKIRKKHNERLLHFAYQFNRKNYAGEAYKNLLELLSFRKIRLKSHFHFLMTITGLNRITKLIIRICFYKQTVKK